MQCPELPGVSFSLSREDQDIPIMPNGKIEQRLNGGTSLTLEARVFAGLEKWYGFTVDYSDRLRVPRPSRSILSQNQDGYGAISYFRNIPLERTRRGNHLVTYSQKNNLRMMFLTEANIDVFTVALIVQDGIPWLAADITYQAEIKGDTIEYERFWPSLFTWISKIQDRSLTARKVEPSLPDPSSFAENNGLVIWWDSSMANAGSGCVMTNEGQASVHWSNVVSRQNSSRKFLKAGERIQFDHKRDREDRSNFPFELVGVEPVPLV